MITDEELESLPEDPQLAFVECERKLRERLLQSLNGANEFDAQDIRLEYMNKIVGAAKAFGIDGLRDREVPSSEHFAYTNYADFLREVDHYTIQIRIHAASRSRRYSVALSQQDKSKIHHFIQQIRLVIEDSGFPIDKREALYSKLNAFAAEVDKSRTSMQTFAAAWLGFCAAVGEGFEKLEPARKWIDSIANLIGHAKEVEDAMRPRLPAPEDRARLEPPRKEIGTQQTPDDEIPF